MAATYEPIATTTLGSAASSITFSSIPSTYTDLRIVFTGTGTTSIGLFGRLNGDTGTNYSFTYLTGTGSGAGSARVSNISYIDLESQNNLSATVPCLKTIDIFSYAGSTYKTMLITQIQDQNGSGFVENQVCLWRSTSAINQISLYVNSSSMAAGTTATLYGIKAA